MRQTIIAAFMLCASFCMAQNQWPICQDAQSKQRQIDSRQIARGETWSIMGAVTDGGVPRFWPTNTVFGFFWQTAGMGTNYWASTNAVYPVYYQGNTNLPYIACNWDYTMDVGSNANTYSFFIGAFSGSGPNPAAAYRINGTMNLYGSPGGGGAQWANKNTNCIWATQGFVFQVISNTVPTIVTNILVSGGAVVAVSTNGGYQLKLGF